MRNSEEWRQYAACRKMDTSLFIPPSEKRGRSVTKEFDKAKEVCARCHVRLHCLNFAIEEGHIEFGIFGGLTPKQRQKLWRKKNIQVTA